MCTLFGYQFSRSFHGCVGLELESVGQKEGNILDVTHISEPFERSSLPDQHKLHRHNFSTNP